MKRNDIRSVNNFTKAMIFLVLSMGHKTFVFKQKKKEKIIYILLSSNNKIKKKTKTNCDEANERKKGLCNSLSILL